MNDADAVTDAQAVPAGSQSDREERGKRGMSRGSYILCLIGLFALGLLVRWSVYENPEMAPLVILIGIPLSICAIVCHVKRCHNIGKSGWFVLWLLVPIVSLLVLLYLMVTPGTPREDVTVGVEE